MAFQLQPGEFKSPLDYVRSFVSEVRKLHSSDAKNEQRRKESLGHIFNTENLQPLALRTPLLTPDGFERDRYFLTGIVPVLRETYEAVFNGTKRPTYNLQESTWVQDEYVFGVLTAEDVGQIPSVTICEQLNDLRVDPRTNNVLTYLFRPLETSLQLRIPNPAAEITSIK
jgi:hypothetical protein